MSTQKLLLNLQGNGIAEPLKYKRCPFNDLKRSDKKSRMERQNMPLHHAIRSKKMFRDASN